ncbi:MAG: tRNA pseudouridine(55) synthase TruB [Planctomycetaceae bacterium]|nr:tRNA pseudouridine(55) synthase TruB [Planctomycetaceae bacterium]
MSRFPAGVLNLCKPAGVTSRDVVNQVQRLVRPAKAGHAGTLDPLATGVLVVCLGAATRLISYVQAGRKEYRATFRLGETSDTDDATGNVVSGGDPAGVTRDDLETVLSGFIGRIEQVPPQVSAVHVDGERAYQRVRRGETVDIAARIVEVDSIDLVDFTSPEFTIHVTCGGGTYIRSIGRDVGATLGCGAVMTALERTAVGPFRIADALPAEQLNETTLRKHCQSPAVAVSGLPRVIVSIEQVRAIRCGQGIAIAEALTDGLRVPLAAGFGRQCVSRVGSKDTGDTKLPPVAPHAEAMADGVEVAMLDADGELVGVGKFDAASQQLRPCLVLPTARSASDGAMGL